MTETMESSRSSVANADEATSRVNKIGEKRRQLIRKVKEHGSTAAGLLAFLLLVEAAVTLLDVGNVAENASDASAMRQFIIIAYGVAVAIAVGLGVFIQKRASTWACGLLAFLGGILALLALNEYSTGTSIGWMRFWCLGYLAVALAAGDAILASIKVSKLDDGEGVDEVGEADVARDHSADRQTVERRRPLSALLRVVVVSVVAATMLTGGLGLYFWGKFQGASDGAGTAQAPASAGMGPAAVPETVSAKASDLGLTAQAFQLAYQGDAPIERQMGEATYSFAPTEVEGASGLIPVEGMLILVTDGFNLAETGTSSGLVSVHYFQREGEHLRPVGAWPNLSQAGSNGRISGANLRRDLLQDPTLMVKGGWMGQGCSVDFVELIELTPQAPILRASVQTGYSWTGQDEDGNELPPTELSSTIIRTAKGFKVVYTGEVSRTVEYVKRGDKYEPTTSVDDLPGC